MVKKYEIAVVIPFYQKKTGLLNKAIDSVKNQTIESSILVVVVDDGSPVSASASLFDYETNANINLEIIKQENGGAGNARNTGLDNIPSSVNYVAFLDSDDVWFPEHLEHALAALDKGYDFYFSDHISALYKNQSNYERIGTLNVDDELLIDPELNIYEMKTSVINHIVSDGGGVIGTSNVVYRFSKFGELRFREEFYNGQDFFFWMDLCQFGAKASFSTYVDCDCGRGINIYSNSGWGSDLSLQRMKNELKIWTSVEKIYDLGSELQRRNLDTIKRIEQNITMDILHRLKNKKKISAKIMKEIFSLRPKFLLLLPFHVASVVFSKMSR